MPRSAAAPSTLKRIEANMLAGLRVTRAAVNEYKIAQRYLHEGLLRLGDPADLRSLVALINRKQHAPGTSVSAGLISGVIALDAVYRRVTARYCEENPDILEAIIALDDEEWSAKFEAVDNAGLEVIFHTLALGNPMPRGRLDGLLRLEIDDADLYERTLDLLACAPAIESEELHTFLERPVRAAPHSLAGQIDYIVENWAEYLDDTLLQVLLRSRDRITEETKFAVVGGRPSSHVYTFEGGDPERFTQDKDWMPSVVLVAKNIYVWLAQLSKKYDRGIKRLDQVPDAELKILAERGITGLWMIGLWERSDASRQVKQLCGSHSAVASAYSLYDYEIAQQLGGYLAYTNLRDRALKYGVRLAADMVPNHVGIDSDWVRNHPERLLSLPESPYPSYSFGGADLCDDPNVSVNIEDGYFDQSDAAVVFKRYDHRTGEASFIYHGNDGTSMPWNDTAQIDFLNAEAREAVIQRILHVARMFSIIRFDAAMTLVKKHIQRLWFPEPGTGGAIPSRADYGISREELDRMIPKEFWAEVVDRIAEELPDTLLLAEAFWMLEGYFVRSLGMHRVYNSAFMNMLRDEKNNEYRLLMRNTLEFDPQILKRYVNFMNNPDEDTAADQFGKDSKYFGICTMMVTLPGLPMIGHGQVEGFSEKYGMDFAEPMLDEVEDEGFVRYHEQRIFPLLHRRRLFAEVENFYLYDLENEDGVDENVFVYSNRRDGERALVVYHNRFGETQGWVKRSVGFNNKPHGVEQRSLADGLDLPHGEEFYATFTDLVSGDVYIRHVESLRCDGFFARVDAYRCQVFLDWAFVQGGDWAELHQWLGGRGVTSFDNARLDKTHGHVYEALKTCCVDQDCEALSAIWDVTIEPRETSPLMRAFMALTRVSDPEVFARYSLSYGLGRFLSEDAIIALKAAHALNRLDDWETFEAWLELPEIQAALGVHEFEDKLWVSGERWRAVSQHLAAILPEADGLRLLDDAIEAAGHRFDHVLFGAI